MSFPLPPTSSLLPYPEPYSKMALHNPPKLLLRMGCLRNTPARLAVGQLHRPRRIQPMKLHCDHPHHGAMSSPHLWQIPELPPASHVDHHSLLPSPTHCVPLLLFFCILVRITHLGSFVKFTTCIIMPGGCNVAGYSA